MIKNKAICFDLDGVIINSLPNMQKSWEETCKKNNLHIPFSKYKNVIGLKPFKLIINKPETIDVDTVYDYELAKIFNKNSK